MKWTVGMRNGEVFVCQPATSSCCSSRLVVWGQHGPKDPSGLNLSASACGGGEDGHKATWILSLGKILQKKR